MRRRLSRLALAASLGLALGLSACGGGARTRDTADSSDSDGGGATVPAATTPTPPATPTPRPSLVAGPQFPPPFVPPPLPTATPTPAPRPPTATPTPSPFVPYVPRPLKYRLDQVVPGNSGLLILDPAAGTATVWQFGPTGNVDSISPDGRFISWSEAVPPFAQGKPRAPHLLDTSSGHDRVVLWNAEWLYPAQFSPDGRRFLAANSSVAGIFPSTGVGPITWLPAPSAPLAFRKDGIPSGLPYAVWSPDGTRIAITRSDDEPLLIVGRDGSVEAVMGVLPGGIAWSSDSERVAFTDKSRATILDVASGQTLTLLPGGWAGEWSPDNRYFAVQPVQEHTQDYVPRANVYDARTGQEILRLAAFDPCTSGVWFEDGTMPFALADRSPAYLLVPSGKVIAGPPAKRRARDPLPGARWASAPDGSARLMEGDRIVAQVRLAAAAMPLFHWPPGVRSVTTTGAGLFGLMANAGGKDYCLYDQQPSIVTLPPFTP